MAVKIPKYPWAQETNRLYHHLYDVYTGPETSWDIVDLQMRFPAVFLDQILRDQILKPVSGDRLVPAFNVLGTTSQLILELVSGEIRSYLEIAARLPKVITKQQSLKHNLSFLFNFRQIQYFTSPASALTYIGIESNQQLSLLTTHNSDETIDDIYWIADFLEQRYQYKIDIEETLSLTKVKKHL